jgi:asparagine synthase (glutamine-hydrolysing)
VGDAELIVEAYLKWGHQCTDWLLGDFAFALWDPRERQLFCARDHFGMRPFYYHYSQEQRFVFASDARAIVVLPQVPHRINERRISDFLVPELEWIDYSSTFFEDVYRLPPGHKAIVTRNGVEITEYWEPEPAPDPGVLSDEDYREGFLEVLTKAVESRLRAPSGTIGSMLSGGIDSGSVVAIAKDILNSQNGDPLHTYSATRTGEKNCTESNAIRAAVAMQNISPTLVKLEELGANFKSLLSGNEEPFDGQAMILKAIYLAAHEQGRCVLLDGAGGDVVLSDGSYIVRIIRRCELGTAIREITSRNRLRRGSGLGPDVFQYTAAALIPEALKQLIRGPKQRGQARRYIEKSLIKPDFARDVSLLERFDRMWHTFPSSWQPNFAAERCVVIRPSVTAGRERYARLAAATASEARDPFLDKRVVDFCSTLPGHLRLRNGWPKIILRELMADRVPEEVRWLPGKPHLGWLFNLAVTREAAKSGALTLSGMSKELAPYVDRARLAHAWREFEDGGAADHIHSAHVLSLWLRENATRPLVPD